MTAPLTTYVAYCDGASRKDGRGGWGAHIQKKGVFRAIGPVDIYGGEHDTTNNRMELMAVIETLWYLPEGSVVQCVCDSKYVILGATDYIHTWKRAGWRTSANKPVKNIDLWQELELAMQRHQSVTFKHVRGHTGVEGNEIADRLAAKGVPEVHERKGPGAKLDAGGSQPRAPSNAPAMGRGADRRGIPQAQARRTR